MALARVGFFSELRHGEPNGPSLHDAIGKLRADKQPIVAYLRQAAALAVTGGTSAYDVLDPALRRIGPLSVLTDGAWIWPSDLPYYVEQYEVDLPAAFLRHGASLHWTPPALSDRELNDVEDRLFRQR